MEAARDIQPDALSILKRISKYTVDAPVHILWQLSASDLQLRNIKLGHLRKLCERAMRSCLDGQKVTPKIPRYQYFNRIFEDLLECLQMEHDPVFCLCKRPSSKFSQQRASTENLVPVVTPMHLSPIA
jgi:hypothetical protein